MVDSKCAWSLNVQAYTQLPTKHAAAPANPPVATANHQLDSLPLNISASALVSRPEHCRVQLKAIADVYAEFSRDETHLM
jgi:hypothetical protein